MTSWTQMNLRLKVEEKGMLEALCEAEGISMAQALKDYIHSSHQAGKLLAKVETQTQEVSPVAPDALEEIRDRLDVIDKQIGDLSSREWVQDNRDYIVKIMDEKGLLLIREHEEVLKLLGDRLSTLESGHMELVPDDMDKLVNIVKQRILEDGLSDRLNQLETGQPELHETMTNLVERLEKLEGWISSLRDDRALAKGSLGKFSDRLDALEKGKVETAPREIPKGLTHKQIAEICNVSTYAVTKMAHDRSKWPEGYMWSDESKKWFPMEV